MVQMLFSHFQQAPGSDIFTVGKSPGISYKFIQQGKDLPPFKAFANRTDPDQAFKVFAKRTDPDLTALVRAA